MLLRKAANPSGRGGVRTAHTVCTARARHAPVRFWRLVRGSRLVRDEHGQALPLLALAIVALLAGGVVVFQLALSTNYATAAQTAADAAALAAEKNVISQLQTPRVVNGISLPATIDWGAVRDVANDYAEANGAYVVGLMPAANPAGSFAPDVIVAVATTGSLPGGNSEHVDAGDKAHATARASIDPLSKASPGTLISNDASLGSGPRFVSHGGKYGFFPRLDTDYNVGAEAQIAGRLDQLGIKLKLHLVGTAGYLPAGTPGVTALHTCGAVATTRGLTGVTDGQLKDAGLMRIVPPQGAQPQEIALTGTTLSACAQGTPTPSVPTIGNSNVHLVPQNGGPSGTFVAWPGAGAGIGGPWAIPTSIVMCESGGRNLPPNSAGASGYYQIIPSTWKLFDGPGPAAYLAPKWVQDQVAARIWNNGAGASNWVCAGIVGIT